jgi:hypothetical protein
LNNGNKSHLHENGNHVDGLDDAHAFTRFGRRLKIISEILAMFIDSECKQWWMLFIKSPRTALLHHQRDRN